MKTTKTFIVALLPLLIILCISTIFGEETDIFGDIQASYDKFRNKTLEVRYIKEVWIFQNEENIVERLSDGKVLVKLPGTRIQQSVKTESQDIDTSGYMTKIMEIDPSYNLPIDKKVYTGTMWLKGERCFAESLEDDGTIVYEKYDGEVYGQMIMGKGGHNLVIWGDKKNTYDKIPVLLEWYYNSWVNPTEKTVGLIESDTEVTIVEKGPSDKKRETILDKTNKYMPKAKRYHSNDILLIETLFDGKKEISDICLPTTISRKEFRSADKPQLFIFYKDLIWEQVDSSALEDKFSIPFSEDAHGVKTK